MGHAHIIFSDAVRAAVETAVPGVIRYSKLCSFVGDFFPEPRIKSQEFRFHFAFGPLESEVETSRYGHGKEGKTWLVFPVAALQE